MSAGERDALGKRRGASELELSWTCATSPATMKDRLLELLQHDVDHRLLHDLLVGFHQQSLQLRHTPPLDADVPHPYKGNVAIGLEQWWSNLNSGT